MGQENLKSVPGLGLKLCQGLFDTLFSVSNFLGFI